MSDKRAALLHLGRSRSLGSRRRVDSWARLLSAAGAQVEEVALLPDHRRRVPAARDLVLLGRGAIVPEALVWSPRSVLTTLRDLSPDVLVCVTSRAWHPALAGSAQTVVLDYVDSLGRSYGDRAMVTCSGPRGAGLRSLGAAHRRFEGRPPPGTWRAAAGRGDARRLDAHWVPNLALAWEQSTGAKPDVDLLFFGNLAYEPNIAGLRRLAALWPRLQVARPGVTAMVAGACGGDEVRDLALHHRWRLVEDFDDLTALCRRARLAFFPLPYASGLQNKVLEAAALGVAQVVSREATDGLDDEFPAAVGATDDELVGAVCRLLADDSERLSLASAAREHVLRFYGVERWQDAARALLVASG